MGHWRLLSGDIVEGTPVGVGGRLYSTRRTSASRASGCEAWEGWRRRKPTGCLYWIRSITSARDPNGGSWVDLSCVSEVIIRGVDRELIGLVLVSSDV